MRQYLFNNMLTVITVMLMMSIVMQWWWIMFGTIVYVFGKAGEINV